MPRHVQPTEPSTTREAVPSGTTRARMIRFAPWIAGLVVAFVASRAAQLETKWVAYFLAAQVVVLVAALSNIRRWLLIAFVLTLQLNVHYFIETVPPSYLGNSGPNYLSIVLVTIAALSCYVYHLLAVERPGRLLRDSFAAVPTAVWLLLAAMLISTMFSTVRKFGVYAIVEYIQFMLIFTAAACCIRSSRDLRLVVILLLVTLGFQAVIAVVQSIFGIVFTPLGKIIYAHAEGGSARVTGTVATTPSSFGAFMEPLIYMAGALLFIEKRTGRLILLAALFMGGAAAALMTINRTTWASIPVGCFLTFALTTARTSHRLNWRKLMRAAGVVCALAVLVAVVAYPLLEARLSATDTAEDFDTRMNLVHTAVAMIRDNPVVGVGPGAYTFHMQRYAATSSGWKFIVHNEYLLIWADLGTFGLVAWLLWYLGGLRRVWQATTIDVSWVRAVSTGWFVGLALRLWYWMLWSSFEFCSEALPWFLFGAATAALRIANEKQPHRHA